MLSNPRAGGWCAVAIVALFLGHACGASASTPPVDSTAVSGPLSLERVFALVARHEPERVAAELRSQAAQARIGAADRRPNPALALTEENFGGGLGGGHREATLALEQSFELGGDRGARRASAEAELALARADAAGITRAGEASAAERFLAAWTLQARAQRLAQGRRDADEAIRAAADRHRAGASPEVEILRARDRAAALDVERQRVESALRIARQELALTWGATTAGFDTLAAPQLVAPDEGAAPRAGHPDRARAEAAQAVAAARLRAATAARTPDLTLSLGVRRLEEVRATGFVAGAQIPIPLWNRGQDDVTAARIELAATSGERRAVEQRLQVRLAVARENARSAETVLDTLRASVRPSRVRLVEELLGSYRAGRSSYLDLVAEQAALLDTENALIDAQADVWRAQLVLQQLTGTGLFAPKEKP